jgi:hypothetical protein
MSTASPSAAPTDPDPAPLHPDPAIAATLEFDPVPGKIARANGWSPEIQRAFIAALAASGSPTKAAETVDLALTGAERARDREGGESFSAAWDRALRVYAAHRRARVNAAVASLQSAIPALPRPHPPKTRPRPHPKAPPPPIPMPSTSSAIPAPRPASPATRASPGSPTC